MQSLYGHLVSRPRCWKVWIIFTDRNLISSRDSESSGLQEYGPVHSREAHILSRFPQRNQFISDYIYRKTGKYRSSKQIGSRLQQFKDTSEGRECK